MNSIRQHTDQELITLLIQGDRQAFTTIYRENATDLITYVKRSVSVKEDWEEIVQDAFESLWTKHEGLHHVTELRAYLFKMVKYKIVDYLRHSLVKRKYEEHYLLFETVYDNLNDQVNEGIDFQALLDRSIGQLPTRCQVAFRLRIHENLPYKDIAERMEISTSAVEKHISAALQHMREAYQNAYKTSS